MNSKEKVMRALNHQSGPVPIDVGMMPTTGIHISMLEKLRDYYGLEKKTPFVFEPYQMLGEVDDDLREILGIDTKPLWSRGTMFGFSNEGCKPFMTPWGQKVNVAERFMTTEDDEKVYIYAEGDMSYPPTAQMPKSSFFFDTVIRQKPIDDSNLNVQDNLEEFGEISDEDLEYYKKMKLEFQDSPYFVAGNLGGTAIGDIACVPGPMLKDPKGIRDIQEWYMSTVMRKEYLHKIFDGQVDIALKNLEKIHQVLGDTIQCAYICGNDFGTQNGPFCSVNTFKELYKPYYKKINDWIHSNTNWKTFKHTCGAIYPLIPEMIEAGFDILNPVQWTAKDMDMHRLKAEFGKDIVFWGGGVDTQKTLPFGTPDQVHEEVLRVCEVFSKDGGFVFNTIHNIQAQTPIENLVAMFDAVKEFNGNK
jgi:hypothetical protein